MSTVVLRALHEPLLIFAITGALVPKSFGVFGRADSGLALKVWL